MPITFSCPCGKALRVAEEHAGKRTKCPACQAVVTAPKPEPQFEVVEDEPQKLVPTPAAKPAAKPVAKPAKHDEDDEDEGRGYSVAKKSADDEDDAPKPKKKPQFRKNARRDDDDDDYEHDRPKKRGRSSGPPNPDAGKKILYLIGGLLMIALGGVVLYLGLDSDSGGRRPIRGIIFGICFIVGGLGTMVKGATGNFDDDE